MTGAATIGLLGLGLAAISAWLHVKGKDGGGWAVLAFLLIVASCWRAI